jgi:hypothetical protein
MSDIGNLEELMMEIKETLEPELHSSRDEVLSRVGTWAAKIEAALETNPARRLDEPDGTEHLPMTP